MSSSAVETSINRDLFNPTEAQVTRSNLVYAINVFDVLPLPALLIIVFIVYAAVLILFRYVAYRVVSGAGQPSTEPRGAGICNSFCLCCVNCSNSCGACDNRGTLGGCANGVCPHRRSGVLFSDVLLCHQCERKTVNCCQADCDDCFCFCFECRFRKNGGTALLGSAAD
uniref:Uncharacterized protein n=1 Tax=Macrostomum lignano TaxID=282301 RepID=A0A1I8IUZ7_9PLAT